jgi:hypothetical protein
MLTEVLLFCLTNMSLVFYYDLEIVFIFDKIILPIWVLAIDSREKVLIEQTR